jgi:hypothetical protein
MKFRPRFGLRTLFLAITAISVWLGWQCSIARERKHWFATYFTTERGCAYPECFDGRPYKPSVNWMRQILGDQACACIDLPGNAPDQFVRDVRHAFPEAYIKMCERPADFGDHLQRQ